MEGERAAGSSRGRRNSDEEDRPVPRRSARLAKTNAPSVSTGKTTSSVARAREADLLAKREAAALDEKIDQARREVELLEHEVKALVDQLQEIKVREVSGPEEREARRLEVRALEASLRTKANDVEAKRINLKYLGKSVDREKELLEDQREVSRLLLEEEDEDRLSQDLSGEEIPSDVEDFESAFEGNRRSPSPEMQDLWRRLTFLRGDDGRPANQQPPPTPQVDPSVTVWKPKVQPSQPPIVNSADQKKPTTPEESTQQTKTPEEPTSTNAVEHLALVLSQALGKASRNTTDTNQKMLARQAMKTELSPFDGSPAEWPVFKQQYHTVTTACGLSDVENLQRLQRSLKGEARESVSALLMNPENVDKILSVLEKRFGNAERIIQMMVQQVSGMTAVREGDYRALLKLIDSVRNLAETATTMQCEPYLTNPQLINNLIEKLPAQFQVEWAKYRSQLGKSYPDLRDVSKWMESVGDFIAHLHNPACSSDTQAKKPSFTRPSKVQKSFAATDAGRKSETKKCRVCSKDTHHLSKCDKFNGWDVEERWRWVRNNRYCFSCLNYGHGVADCRGKRNCGQDGCEKPHHRKLHLSPRLEVVVPDPPFDRVETLGHTVVSGHINLNILPVVLQGPRGSMKTFAMLDPGATLTVLEAEVADRLGLKGPTRSLTHSGLHDPVTVTESRCVELQVSGSSGEVFSLRNVRTMPHLSLPRQSVKRTTMNRWSHLKRLPITLYDDAKPTILIGQDNAHLCNTSDLVLGPSNAPAAGKSKLGWVLMGRVGATQEQHVSYHLREETEDELHQLVKYHFSLEAFGVKPNVNRPRSKEDTRAEEILKDTLKRVGDKWECGLLRKSDEPQLPLNSKETAYRRLLSMERKMDASPEFAAAYQEKIAAYLQKGYAKKLTEEEAAAISPKTFYLPHFMAKNPKKQNKLRFVFDAAAKTSGRSLNDSLLPGPDLLRALPSVLFKFRQRKIAVTADVRDMFHRVHVKKEDAEAQRFLWRGMDRKKEPETFQMEVLIFGATCSPTIAQKAKNENALLFSSKYPETSDAITNNMYVDDYADSVDQAHQAVQRFHEMREVMSHGNFEMLQWLSNSPEVMASVPEDLRGKIAQQVELGNSEATERVLGLFWKPVEDLFTFSLSFIRIKEDQMEGGRMPTKVELLSIVMSIYDALGFISIFTVRGKMLLQDCWRTKIGWQDELPETLREKWESWREGLKRIADFQLPRCYSVHFSTATIITLHVFVDASEQAYGAVAYFVVESPTGREVTLVTSKARVAPLKPLSIPRMELVAAVLGARLGKFVRDEHTVPINRTVYWSDSRTVLCWLQGDGRKFQQFVAHRVGEIQELTNPEEWRWVPTKLNVADELTRDTGEMDWSPKSRWVCGPDFLLEEDDCWPKEERRDPPPSSNMELKKEFIGATLESPPLGRLQAEKYSSWSRLIRHTAWITKFGRWVMKLPVSSSLTTDELAKAEKFWWRTVQKECFGEELQNVTLGKTVARDSKICHLALQLHEDGVLRLQGRLKNAAVQDSTKNPVLLDPKHVYARLLLSHLHQQAGHHGQERVVNEVRQKFHIPHVRAAVRGTWTHCQKCKNDRATPQPPLMGQLPFCRLEAGVYPFANTGVDYFGPMEVTIGRRHEKRWGALFTCMSTRAVHLELAASLSTDSCIMAIRRFVGRRGCPRNIYSDNGTNFHGANNELQKALQELDQNKISSACAEKTIQWHFNPPSAPHMGGSWERLVKSVKVALYATIKEQTPREEVLQTLLVEAEHSVNSHPLTHVSIDPEDPEALTPNHFLIGRSSNVAPAGVFDEDDLSGRKAWRKAQRLADMFWKRWIKEYLPTLQRRTKWMKITKPVKVGDVAVEVDPQQPRNKWTMGIVTSVFPGEDGIVRVVEWKTAAGSYRRPVAKLAFFDVKRDEEPAPSVANDAAAPSGVGGCRRPFEEEEKEFPIAPHN